MTGIQKASWAFLEHFRPPEDDHPELSRIAPWLAQLETRLSAGLVALTAEQQLWSERLAELGGDPTAFDFESFRPLRISREEDWSDWLAHLLQTSTVGAFARELFDGDCATSVIREASLGAGARRADLLCRWATGKPATHVEVKVGDDAFEKTFESNRGLSLDGFQPSSGLSVGRLGTRRLPYIYAPSEPHVEETIQAILPALR